MISNANLPWTGYQVNQNSVTLGNWAKPPGVHLKLKHLALVCNLFLAKFYVQSLQFTSAAVAFNIWSLIEYVGGKTHKEHKCVNKIGFQIAINT